MHKQAEADLRVMPTTFSENLQLLKPPLEVICDMSQAMTTYYREKSRDKYCWDNPAAAAPTRVTAE